jgi:hypothetical protein
VSVMLRATSPCARWLKRLAVAPPGEAASSISPTASSGERPKLWAMAKHAAGRMPTWQTNATNTARG